MSYHRRGFKNRNYGQNRNTEMQFMFLKTMFELTNAGNNGSGRGRGRDRGRGRGRGSGTKSQSDIRNKEWPVMVSNAPSDVTIEQFRSKFRNLKRIQRSDDLEGGRFILFFWTQRSAQWAIEKSPHQITTSTIDEKEHIISVNCKPLTAESTTA